MSLDDKLEISQYDDTHLELCTFDESTYLTEEEVKDLYYRIGSFIKEDVDDYSMPEIKTATEIRHDAYQQFSDLRRKHIQRTFRLDERMADYEMYSIDVMVGRRFLFFPVYRTLKMIGS